MLSKLLLSHLLHHANVAARALRRCDLEQSIEAVMLCRACAKALDVGDNPDGVVCFSEVYYDMLCYVSDTYPIPDSISPDNPFR